MAKKFRLSKRSLARLEGVDERLVRVMHYAITVTDVDFGITEGLRTVARQRELVKSGASKTMASKHIEGKAVDVVAYIGDRISWEIPLYVQIANAVHLAAHEVGVPIRWGAAWHIGDIRTFDGNMQDAMDSYVKLRQSQGVTPFVDAMHIEIGIT